MYGALVIICVTTG